MMNHQFILCGGRVSLNQSKEEILTYINALLSLTYPPEFVQAVDYRELNDHTFELDISRQFANGKGHCLCGFINNLDMELITGLDNSFFNPYATKGRVPFVLIPWYDGLAYAADRSFGQFWKDYNQQFAHENIFRTQITPGYSILTLKIIYSTKPSNNSAGSANHSKKKKDKKEKSDQEPTKN